MHVLVAGAGILGRELIHVLLEQQHEVTAMALDKQELAGFNHPSLTCISGDVTKPDTIAGICKNVAAVVSCIGITRIRGTLTHDSVDYQGNLNLLREAERAGVKKFAIVSPEGVQRGRKLAPLLEARQKFEVKLTFSSIGWIVIHAGGFFSDLAEMAKMARTSPMFAIGNGETTFTPIAVADLALFVADSLKGAGNKKLHVGGPETMTWNQILALCFNHWGAKPRIVHVPAWICRVMLVLIRPFSAKYYAMGRLLVFMSTTELPTPTLGKERLADYFSRQLSVA